MKESLISFETAKLAKELGFNWETRAFYFLDLLEECNGPDNYVQWMNWNKENTNYISVPTQSLLQKWLRDKYELYITILRKGIGSDEWVFTYEIEFLPLECHNKKRRARHFKNIKSPFCIGISTYNGGWNSYEEALEKGLIHALKQLKENDTRTE